MKSLILFPLLCFLLWQLSGLNEYIQDGKPYWRLQDPVIWPGHPDVVENSIKRSAFLLSAKWIYTAALAATILSQVAKVSHKSMFIAWMILVYTVLWVCFCVFQTQVQ